MRRRRRGIVRSAALRRGAFSLRSGISMGLRSGEYWGRYRSVASRASIASRRAAVRLAKALDPDNCGAGTNRKLLGRLAPRSSTFDLRNHSLPHLPRIGLRHRPASQKRINADRLSHLWPHENPPDSIGAEHALVPIKVLLGFTPLSFTTGSLPGCLPRSFSNSMCSWSIACQVEAAVEVNSRTPPPLPLANFRRRRNPCLCASLGGFPISVPTGTITKLGGPPEDRAIHPISAFSISKIAAKLSVIFVWSVYHSPLGERARSQRYSTPARASNFTNGVISPLLPRRLPSVMGITPFELRRGDGPSRSDLQVFVLRV